MLETRETEIDGHRYEVTLLGGFRGLRLLARIGAAVGPALAKAAAMYETGAAGLGEIGSALEALFVKLTPDELEHFVKELLIGGDLKQDGVPVGKTFELTFSGKMMLVGKLLAFAFGANYGDFSDAARALIAPAAKTPSQTSTAG